MRSPRTLAAAGALALLSAVGACAGDESVTNAQAGECIEEVEDLALLVSEIPEIDCSEDHNGEIIGTFTHEGDDDDFPGSIEIGEAATEGCEETFEDYTGEAVDDTSLSVRSIDPTESTWGDGDRESICVAFTTGGATVDESFEGNGEDFLSQGGGSGDTDDDEGSGEGGPEVGDAGPVPTVTEDDVLLSISTVEDLEAALEACEAGDFAACDDVYATTARGSEAETYGSTCGGRIDESAAIPNACESTLG